MTKRKDPLDLKRPTLDQWEATYKPTKNHLGGNGAYDGMMYETYGAEERYVFGQNDALVWTVLDVSGKLYLVPGRHFVNRFGYFVCQQPWKDATITVHYA